MLNYTKKLGLAALAFAAVAMTVPTIAQAKTDEAAVAATVNGSSILKKDVMNVLDAQGVKGDDQAKAFPLVVDQMVAEKLVSQETAKANIEKDPQFEQRLAQAKNQIVTTLFFEHYLKDKVNDKTVKAEYEKFKKDNSGKEEVHASHILLKTEDEAKKVIQDLDGGAKFDALAKERSADPSGKNGGDLGYFSKDELVPEFAEAAFSLKPGTYTKTPVKTQFGYHVIFLQEKRARKVPDISQVENQIRTKLGQEAIQKLVSDLRSKATITTYDINGKPLAAGGEAATKKN